MRTIYLLFLILIISCTADKKTDCNYITDYYQIIYEADLAFETKNYKKAFELYQDAFGFCEAKNTMGYNEIGSFTECSAILGKFDITYIYAKKQILYGVELNMFQNNDNFKEFLFSDYGMKFISEYETLRREFIEKANFDLRDELVAMRFADQMYRGRNNNANWTKQDSIDKLHEKRLIEIFESIGYPTAAIVGPHTIDYPVDLQILLLHTKDSIRLNYFVPKVKEFVQNGTAPPNVLGTMIDQYYLYNDKPQIYGTYSLQNDRSGYANMIDDLKKVDSSRISIGLPSLKLKEKKDSLIRIKFGF